jgi:hypothetical protein
VGSAACRAEVHVADTRDEVIDDGGADAVRGALEPRPHPSDGAPIHNFRMIQCAWKA